MAIIAITPTELLKDRIIIKRMEFSETESILTYAELDTFLGLSGFEIEAVTGSDEWINFIKN